MPRAPLLPLAAALLLSPAACLADGKSKLAQEAAEYVISRFGRGAAKEGTKELAKRIEAAAARHGHEMFEAVRKVGPRALPLVERAGANSGRAVRVIAQHGEAGALIAARPSAMNLVAKHGDDAARVLVRHAGSVAEPVVERFGAPAVRALAAAGPQAGRRVAMLSADGHLARIGRTEEVLEVIARYGDRAVTFVWNNKGALAVGVTLAAFLANPEPFLDGTQKIAQVVGESAVRPLAEIPGQAVKGLLTGVNGVLVTLAVIGGVGLIVWRRRKPPAPDQPERSFP